MKTRLHSSLLTLKLPELMIEGLDFESFILFYLILYETSTFSTYQTYHGMIYPLPQPASCIRLFLRAFVSYPPIAT